MIQLARGNIHTLSQEYILEDDDEDLKSEPDLTESFLPKVSKTSKLNRHVKFLFDRTQSPSFAEEKSDQKNKVGDISSNQTRGTKRVIKGMLIIGQTPEKKVEAEIPTKIAVREKR